MVETDTKMPFCKKTQVGEDHLKLLFPLGRSSRGLTLFAPFEKMLNKQHLIILSTWVDFGTTCDVNGVAVDAYGLIRFSLLYVSCDPGPMRCGLHCLTSSSHGAQHVALAPQL